MRSTTIASRASDRPRSRKSLIVSRAPAASSCTSTGASGRTSAAPSRCASSRVADVDRRRPARRPSRRARHDVIGFSTQRSTRSRRPPPRARPASTTASERGVGNAERPRHLERSLLAERDLDRLGLAERGRGEPADRVTVPVQHLDARVDRRRSSRRPAARRAPRRAPSREGLEVDLGIRQDAPAVGVARRQARRAAVPRRDRQRAAGPPEAARDAQPGPRVEVENERVDARCRRTSLRRRGTRCPCA